MQKRHNKTVVKISKSFKTRPLAVETKTKTGVSGKKISQNKMKEEKQGVVSFVFWFIRKIQRVMPKKRITM